MRFFHLVGTDGSMDGGLNKEEIFQYDFSAYLYIWISILPIARGDKYELFFLMIVHGTDYLIQM